MWSSIVHQSGSIKYSAIRFACSMGFLMVWPPSLSRDGQVTTPNLMHVFAGYKLSKALKQKVYFRTSRIFPVQGIRIMFTYECHRVMVLICGWSCLRFEGILVSLWYLKYLFHYVANKDFHDVPNILSSKSFLCLYSSTANKNQEVERDLKPLFYLLVLLTFFSI